MNLMNFKISWKRTIHVFALLIYVDGMSMLSSKSKAKSAFEQNYNSITSISIRYHCLYTYHRLEESTLQRQFPWS